MNNSKIIAFYLPQYHPTLDNDLWWGKGFTEWTNVAKAKPLFPGHHQPNIPSDLGFYDLRVPEVREEQARLAKEAGIFGFCYYHYWFGDGKRELELPFNEVLKCKKPDFPFCLCWANESWHSKFWNNDGSYSSKILIEQKYLGIPDYEKHFYDVLPAFLDERYIKIEGKPLFMIYRPLSFHDVIGFIKCWNELARKNGLTGIYFCAQATNKVEQNVLLTMPFDAINRLRLWDCIKERPLWKKILGNIVRNSIFPHPFIISYKKAIKTFVGKDENEEKIIPTIIPNWDHTPRSGKGGFVIKNSKPIYFRQHVNQILSIVKNKQNKLVFLKSWNEWGEGNYMEPDMKWGKQYLDTLSDCIFKACK